MFAVFVLLLVVVLYRVASGFMGSADFAWMHNFAPVSAVALCGAAFLPRRSAVLLPLAMLFASDVILNVFHYHQPLLTFDIVPRYAALVLIAALGFALRDRARLPQLLGASLLGSLIFFIVTNTGSWITDPGYAKTLAGWTQAMTTGLPGYPSTWWFYRHTLLGDVCFTLLFAGCMALQRTAVPTPEKRESLVPW